MKFSVFIDKGNDTAKFPIFAPCDTEKEAETIANHMNNMNRKAAEISGKAVKFFYTFGKISLTKQK